VSTREHISPLHFSRFALNSSSPALLYVLRAAPTPCAEPRLPKNYYNWWLFYEEATRWNFPFGNKFISPLFITLHWISLDLCSNYHFIIYKILLAFIITASGENASIFKWYLLNPNNFCVDVTDCKDLLKIDWLLSKLKPVRGSKFLTIKQFGKCLFVGRKEEILAKRVFTHA
jgi:hypothetical protein